MITTEKNGFDTPILIVVFNRPEVTRKLFEAIRLAKPSQLFIAADGYRLNKVGEKELCEEVKKIVDVVDWPCTVYKDYLDVNIGPCKRLPSAIDWFFEHVEQGIILEDDCLPDQSFFTFCQEMLYKYKDEEKVMSISGSNFQDKKVGNASYYFSYYPAAWGWATWKRAWKLFDVEMKQYPAFIKENKIEGILSGSSRGERNYWLTFLKKEYEGIYIYWDLKWTFSHWAKNAYCIIPNENLVRNIGFGKDATHSKDDVGLSIPTRALGEIIHPLVLEHDEEADRYLYNKMYKTTFLKKAIYKIKYFLSL